MPRKSFCTCPRVGEATALLHALAAAVACDELRDAADARVHAGFTHDAYALAIRV